MSTFAKMVLLMLGVAFVLGVLAHYRIRSGDVELGLGLIQFSLLFVAMGGVMQLFWLKSENAQVVKQPSGG